MIDKKQQKKERTLKRYIIIATLVFPLFISTPEIHVFGATVLVDVGCAANAKDVDVWSNPACSGAAAITAALFVAIGYIAFVVFDKVFLIIAKSNRTTSLRFIAKAISVILLIIGIIFWGISTYIAGKCAYIYVSSFFN